MAGETENARSGWQALADYVGCSISKLKSRREELVKCGVVIPKLMGRPPRPGVMWFPSDVRKYLGNIARRGERF
jgi:hypothetical protein